MGRNVGDPGLRYAELVRPYDDAQLVSEYRAFAEWAVESRLKDPQSGVTTLLCELAQACEKELRRRGKEVSHVD